MCFPIDFYYPSATSDFKVEFETNLTSTTNPQARIGLYDGGNETMQNGLQVFPNGYVRCYNSGQSSDIPITPLTDVNGNWTIQRVESNWTILYNQDVIVETSCPGDVAPQNMTLVVHNYGEAIYGYIDNIIWSN